MVNGMCCTNCRPDWYRTTPDCNCNRVWSSVLPPPPCPQHGAWSPQTIEGYRFGTQEVSTFTIGWRPPT